MKILMLSKEGDGLGLAQRIAAEGHDLKLFIENPKYRNAGVGIVDRVPSWRPHITETDLVVCDMVGFGNYERLFRERGKPIISCSKLMDAAELDRARGMDLFTRSGVTVPFTQTYNDPSDAEELLSTFESGYVIKPHDNQATSKTLVVRDPAQFRWALGLYNGTITVQQIVEGIEVSTEGWFNGRSFIKPYNHTFEEKRLLPEAGPNTGCMGNVVINAGEGNRLVEHTLSRVEPFLRRVGYRGPVDINCMVTADAAYGLEFTSRIGYDAIEALMEGLQEPVTDLLFETALGVKKEMELGTDVMIAVRLSKAPWPMDEPPKDELGMPIAGITEDNIRHLFLTDILRDDDGSYRYAASDGVLMKATAHARTVNEARVRVYRTIDAIEYPDKQFRRDIGERVTADIEKLKEWGWL